MMAENVKPLKNPNARGPRGPKPKIKNPGKLLKRLLAYIFKNYAMHCIIVVICIFVTVFATNQGTMFMKNLIDEFITPLLSQETPDFTNLLNEIRHVAIFYAFGALAAFINTKTMVYVTQGTLRNLRDDMFIHMESLPIKYFDTHSHGDIMSTYTNDIDTLRQMISQAMPQFIQSGITIISVFYFMITLSVPLTLVTLIMVSITIYATKKSGGLSSKFFLAQQKDIAALNGYIEEMMDGQKVVKVFTHEEESMERFNELNDKLFESANYANRYVTA